MARYVTGQIIKGTDAEYRFVGKTEEDTRNPAMFEKLPPVKKQSLPTMEESTAEELKGINPLWKIPLGVSSQLDKYAYGAKKLFSKTTPTEEQELAGGRAVGKTGLGKAGQIIGDIAITAPAYSAVWRGAKLLPSAMQGLGNMLGAGTVGALSGGVSTPEDRMGGAIRSGGGAALGAGLVSGLTGPFAPRAGSTADVFTKQGVPLTAGQVAGGLPKAVEDASRMINPSVARRQQEAIGGWNRVEVNKVLTEAKLPVIKENISGHRLLQEAQTRLSAAYDKAGIKPVQADATFTKQLTDLENKTAPFLKGDAQKKLSDLIASARSLTTGTKNTQALRDFERIDLSKVATEAESSQLRGAAKLLKEHVEALRGRMGVSTPALDSAYAKFNLMKESGTTQAALDTGLFSPGMLRREVAKAGTTGQLMKGQGLLQQHVATAEPVLGDTIPRIGPGTGEKVFWTTTVPAAATASVVSGNPYILPAWIAALGANKLAYTPQGVRWMTGQYPLQQALGDSMAPQLAPATLGALANRSR